MKFISSYNKQSAFRRMQLTAHSPQITIANTCYQLSEVTNTHACLYPLKPTVADANNINIQQAG